jgi:hypothetical protein
LQSIFDHWIEKLTRDYSATSITLGSILALFSIFSIHAAGFSILIPKPFLSLIDGYFIANLFTRFTLTLAASILLARYLPYALIVIVEKILGYSIYGYLLAARKSKTTRATKKEDNNCSAEGIEVNPIEAPKKTSWINVDHLRDGQNLNADYVLGYTRGYVEMLFVSNLALIQSFSAFIILSISYINPLDALIILIFSGLFLIYFPPNAEYYKLKDFLYNSPIIVVNSKPRIYLSVKKIVVLALSVSFLLGLLHHRMLTKSMGVTGIEQNSTKTSNIILVTASGFLIYTEDEGYSFFSSQLTPNGKFIRMANEP